MKKNYIKIFSVGALMLALTLSSCNKKLKEELDGYSADVETLKSNNASINEDITKLNGTIAGLDGKINTINSTYDITEPIKMELTFNSDNNVAQSLSLSAPYSDNDSYIDDNGSNDYYVWLEKYTDTEFDDYIELEFDYNTGTSTLTNFYAYAEFYKFPNAFSYTIVDNNRVYYYENDGVNPYKSGTVSLDGNTGALDFTITAEFTDAEAVKADVNQPVSGHGSKAIFSYKGTLPVYK